MAENLSNDIQTLLNGAITNVATAITTTGATGFPAANFRVRVDDELMLVTSVGTGTNWTVTRAIEGSVAAAHATTVPVVHVLTAGSLEQVIAEISPYAAMSGSLAASVVANVLTIALKTRNGTDPSITDPVFVAFRNVTLTSGVSNVRSVTAALSLVISAGSTLGFAASETRRVYVGAIDNAGAVELCAWDSLLGTVAAPTGLFAVNESGVVTTVAEGGAGAADSAGVVYSTTLRTSVPVRVLGYIEIQTGATPGNWSNAPSVLQIMGPGVRRTGDAVQRQSSIVTTSATGTTLIPFDNTIPQNTEGDQYATISITPTSAVNVMDVSSDALYSSSTSNNMGAALFQDSIANALVAGIALATATNAVIRNGFRLLACPGTTASITYKLRAGGNLAGTTTFNGNAGAGLYGGVMTAQLIVQEIFA